MRQAYDYWQNQPDCLLRFPLFFSLGEVGPDGRASPLFLQCICVFSLRSLHHFAKSVDQQRLRVFVFVFTIHRSISKSSFSSFPSPVSRHLRAAQTSRQILRHPLPVHRNVSAAAPSSPTKTLGKMTGPAALPNTRRAGVVHAQGKPASHSSRLRLAKPRRPRLLQESTRSYLPGRRHPPRATSLGPTTPSSNTRQDFPKFPESTAS